MNPASFLQGVTPIVDVLGIVGDDRESYAQAILKACRVIPDDTWLAVCERVLKEWRPQYGVKRPVPAVFLEYYHALKPHNTFGVYRPENRDETLAWCEMKISKMGRDGIEYALKFADQVKQFKLWPEVVAMMTTRHAQLPEEPAKRPIGNMGKLLSKLNLESSHAPH